jgi:antitoxin (DNA-binding transcriptional repressor) of toxin-antitoxin stability system
VVTRSGRRVAFITPAPRANGKALRDVFRRWRGNAALDDSFVARVAHGREAAAGDLDADPWRD